MLTDQKFFTKAVTGVIAQGRRSTKRNGMCAYRAPGGLKCAVGMVLDDGDYKPTWDRGNGKDGRHLVKVVPAFRNLNPDMVQDLQQAHDHCTSGGSFVADFTRKAKEIAERYNLKMPAI